jgi:hypothetical protein
MIFRINRTLKNKARREKRWLWLCYTDLNSEDTGILRIKVADRIIVQVIYNSLILLNLTYTDL